MAAALVLALVVALGIGMLGLDPAGAVVNIESLESHEHEPDEDFRQGSVDPTPQQVSAAERLNATTRWNQFGTPRSMVNYDGYLATGVEGSKATVAARNFLAENADVLGLEEAYVRDIESLRMENDTPMADSNGHAVFFRQYFGEDGMPAIKDGSVTVGLTGTADNWKVAYVSSSLTQETGLAPVGTDIGPGEAWVRAANAVGGNFSPGSVTDVTDDPNSTFDLLQVTGLGQDQRARLTALPIPGEVARPAYEAIYLNDGAAQGAEVEAFTQFVDAGTGEVLVRSNNVQQLADGDEVEAAGGAPGEPTTETFDGTFDADSCSNEPQNGPFTVGPGNDSIQVIVNADNFVNDIVLQLFFGAGSNQPVATSDTGTSPEAINYEPEGGVPAGDYYVRVCSFENAEPLPPNTYQGSFAASGAGTGEPVPYPPEWEYFDANPPIGADNASYPSNDTRTVICWNTPALEGSALPDGCEYDVANAASRAPWDTDPKANFTPTFTTSGNNAESSEAWSNFRGPGPTGYRPTSEDRKYSTNTASTTDYSWNNAWYESTNPGDEGRGCSPTELTTPGESNDISAATAALFAAHNRIHDWSYNLGFTEQAYNLQDSNFGQTQQDRENDPELGQSQAGAVGGNAPPNYVGRNNANQTTLNDGIAPITNMYLWQPLPALFYSPCVDGDYDVSVIAHEYGHAIQNRMVAGPDEGLSGLQARSMGESWSDLTAIEYLYEYGYEPGGGANRYAVGPYVTGNKQSGIRNYGMNDSPLNYSNIEYDPNGVVSPHADGEIWSATNFDIRELLMKKYNGRYPSAPGTNLQIRCAEGIVPPSSCPGNRRWAQIFHDAFLLMPSSVSFVDARDAYIAVDRMRFEGANREELWLAFARRGLGEDASSNGSDDRDPKPSFASPLENNAEVTFKPVRKNGKAIGNFEVYVGRYEARTVPVATAKAPGESFAPGTYEVVLKAPKYGLFRYTRTFKAGENITSTVKVKPNLASIRRGATASGDATEGESGSSATQLIDETEETNWRGTDGPVEGQQVTVNLAGGTRKVNYVKVSSFLRPVDEGNKFGDTDTQSRFSALRGFEILTCRASAANDNCSDPDRGFSVVYTNPNETGRGPSSAGVPRPTAPDLGFLTYDVENTEATHVQLRVLSNQCTGGPEYQGDQDADPSTNSDCSEGSEQDEVVRAAELEVYGR